MFFIVLAYMPYILLGLGIFILICVMGHEDAQTNAARASYQGPARVHTFIYSQTVPEVKIGTLSTGHYKGWACNWYENIRDQKQTFNNFENIPETDFQALVKISQASHEADQKRLADNEADRAYLESL